MNLLKRFVRNDNADFDESYDENELYVMPEDLEIPEETLNGVSALENPARKDPEFRSASDAEKVSLKLLQPKSHIEATKIADKLKDGCIVLLDISRLTKEQAHRLVDFLSGVAYVLGGEMIRTNKNITAATLIYAIGAGITAAAGTRLALQWILVKGFRLYSFQLPDTNAPGIVIYCHYLPVSGLGNLRACCLPWMW